MDRYPAIIFDGKVVVYGLTDFVANSGYFCPSEADSFQPYLSSSFNALTWRLGILELLYLQNLIPGRRVVGSGIQQQWGTVWPRTGFINQKDDDKASAVIAQRAGNIVTQTGQPHVYTALNGNGYNRTWLPGELVENFVYEGSPVLRSRGDLYGQRSIGAV